MKRLILLLTIALGSSVSAQTKYGYIEYEKVKIHFPEYNSGQIEIDRLTKKYKDSLSTLSNILEKKIGAHYPQYTLKDSIFLKERVDELNLLHDELKFYYEEGNRFLKSRQEQIDSDLKSLVVTEMKRFSAENNLVCVLNKKAVLYCSNCLDFTEDFILYYKEKKNSH